LEDDRGVEGELPCGLAVSDLADLVAHDEYVGDRLTGVEVVEVAAGSRCGEVLRSGDGSQVGVVVLEVQVLDVGVDGRREPIC
jgi:hypothetical protein